MGHDQPDDNNYERVEQERLHTEEDIPTRTHYQLRHILQISTTLEKTTKEKPSILIGWNCMESSRKGDSCYLRLLLDRVKGDGTYDDLKAAERKTCTIFKTHRRRRLLIIKNVW